MADFYAAIEPDIDDIELGLRVADSKFRELRAAFDHKQAAPLQRAAHDMARLANQIGSLADLLSHRATVATAERELV